MNDLPLDALLAHLWAAVAPYLGAGWAVLQRIWVEAPTPLLTGVIVGMLLTRVLRGVLIVAGLAAMGFVALHVLGISLPSMG
jgi:hypothetical protein